jgi:predicted ATP-grasp superfamily ATP-dependent carboligase
VRVLVYEFASGGGLAGRVVPASLCREGAAMRAALVVDLSAIGHQIITTADARVPPTLPDGVDVVTLPDSDRARHAALRQLMTSVDAVWLIAPETDRCLERLAATAERLKKPLIGSGSEVIRRASDKARLPALLASRRASHPETRAVRPTTDPSRVARAIGYPIVVKPARGAGSDGVGLVRNLRELDDAVAVVRGTTTGAVLLQKYVAGMPVSVSLLTDGRRAVPLTLNAQTIDAPGFSYRGGETPLDHPLASRAIAAAVDACRALPGLRGFVGVDLVLTGSDAVVIEVNPRLTTAYLGVRAAIDENVAALTIAACAGHLPQTPVARRRVRFSSTGRIISSVRIGLSGCSMSAIEDAHRFQARSVCHRRAAAGDGRSR